MRVTVVFKSGKMFVYKRVITLEDRVRSWMIRTSVKQSEVLKAEIESLHLGDLTRAKKRAA